MSVLSQLISRIPGLDDYNEQVRANNAQSAQGLQQASGLMGLMNQMQAQERARRQDPMRDELLSAQVAEVRAKADKMRRESEFNYSIMGSGGGGIGSLTADQAEALAVKAATLNHPGAVGFLKAAELKRRQADEQSALGGMRSQVVADAPAETEGDAVARINAGGGAPMSIGIGDNPNVISRKEGGVADYLASSTYVGAAAKQLQARIDAGMMRDPKEINSRIDNLSKMHMTMTETRGRDDRGQAGRIEIRNMPSPGPEPLEAVYGPDGKTPVLVPRSQASGMRPYRLSTDFGGAGTTKGDFSKSGNEFLASLPDEDRNIVRKIANYEIDPKSLSAKGGHREKMLALAAQYEPSYDDTQYANKRRAIAQFGSGPQGNTVRNLNVAIEHIDTMGRAADALKNGQFTPGNKAWNEVAKVFGQTPPNTFEGIRDFVANEVVKGTIGNAGALADRQEASAKVKASSSPDQLKELMNGWVELMGGQAKGLEQQYQGATGLNDFRERYLRPRTIEAIAIAEEKAGGGSPTDRRSEPRSSSKRTVVDF